MKANEATVPVTRSEAEDFLFLEARLLDEFRIREWYALYSADAVYWIPLDETRPTNESASIVYDTPLRREERVHHLLNDTYPSQQPRSRTLHCISNVSVEPVPEGTRVRSNQVIYETRPGDYQQTGLGAVQSVVCSVEHVLRREGEGLRIAHKKILILNRDSWLGNLTFLM